MRNFGFIFSLQNNANIGASGGPPGSDIERVLIDTLQNFKAAELQDPHLSLYDSFGTGTWFLIDCSPIQP